MKLGSLISFVCLGTVFLQSKVAESVIPGGLTDEKDVDPNDSEDKHVIEITAEVWKDAEDMAGMSFDEFVAVRYRSQVVAGTNYYIKVLVGDDTYVHICVYNHWSGSVKLTGIETDKKLDDPIEPCNEV